MVAIQLGRTVHETSQCLRMDCQQYGTLITLLEPGKCGLELIPQDLSNFKQEKRDADDTNKKKTREPCVPLRLCYDTFVLLLLISITVIATIYTSHIQKHVQEVDARADDLAAQVLSLQKLVESLMSGETAVSCIHNS